MLGADAKVSTVSKVPNNFSRPKYNYFLPLVALLGGDDSTATASAFLLPPLLAGATMGSGTAAGSGALKRGLHVIKGWWYSKQPTSWSPEQPYQYCPISSSSCSSWTARPRHWRSCRLRLWRPLVPTEMQAWKLMIVIFFTFNILEFFGATRQKILAPPGRSGAFGAWLRPPAPILAAARARELAEVRKSLWVYIGPFRATFIFLPTPKKCTV